MRPTSTTFWRICAKRLYLPIAKVFVISVRLQPKTEEFLYFLLWSADQLIHPTFRNLNGSYESWAYRHGLLRQIATLEKQKFVECKETASDARFCRLTAQGRLHALGGRDPEAQWSRPWDGRWRLVLFDVPVEHNAKRSRLRRYLRSRGFGYLQNSVWITPDALLEEIETLRGARVDVESLILLEARPCAGESDGDIVAGAWDFRHINRLYNRHLDVLAAQPTGRLARAGDAQALRRWAAAERAAWIRAVSSDPLLPQKLLPSDYLGRRAWQGRIRSLGRANRDLRTFHPATASKEK